MAVGIRRLRGRAGWRRAARLAPASDGTWEDMVAAGEVMLADPPSDLLDVRPLKTGKSTTAELTFIRSDER